MSAELDMVARLLSPRLGQQIHVVDHERRVNTVKTVRELLSRLPELSAVSIFYDQEVAAYRPLSELRQKVDEADSQARRHRANEASA